MKAKCENCGREFEVNRMWQRFCDNDCRGAFHRHRYRQQHYRQQVIEDVEERRLRSIERREAKEAIARIIAEAGNGRKFVRRL